MTITDVRTAEIKGYGFAIYARIKTDEVLLGLERRRDLSRRSEPRRAFVH